MLWACNLGGSPLACTNTQFGMLAVSESCSSRKPCHALGSDFLFWKLAGATDTACTLHRPPRSSCIGKEGRALGLGSMLHNSRQRLFEEKVSLLRKLTGSTDTACALHCLPLSACIGYDMGVISMPLARQRHLHMNEVYQGSCLAP